MKDRIRELQEEAEHWEEVARAYEVKAREAEIELVRIRALRGTTSRGQPHGGYLG